MYYEKKFEGLKASILMDHLVIFKVMVKESYNNKTNYWFCLVDFRLHFDICLKLIFGIHYKSKVFKKKIKSSSKKVV